MRFGIFFNKTNGFVAGDKHKYSASQLKVYNNSPSVLTAGSVVSFSVNRIISGAVPVIAYDSGNQNWGIMKNTISPDVFGDCIIAGPVEVEISGTGEFAVPAADGKSFTAGTSGAKILCMSEGKGIILLGGGGGAAASVYNGQHKLILHTADNQGVKSYSVHIADGATFDPATGNSDTSRVEVNGISFDLQPQQFALTTLRTLYVYVTFSAATNSTAASVKYEIGRSLPVNSSSFVYYLIGRCVYKDGAFTVQQDHIGTSSNGIVRINWGRMCNVE